MTGGAPRGLLGARYFTYEFDMHTVRRDPNTGYVDRYLWVPKSFVNVTATKQGLTHLITDKYTGATKALELYKESEHHLLVPRALWETSSLLFPVVDCRPGSYTKTGIVSKLKLDHRLQADGTGGHAILPTGDTVQEKSFDAMNAAMGGVLQLACGKGKTGIALHVIAAQQVPALVLVDNTHLLTQWATAIEQFLDVPGGVGILAGGEKDWKKFLVLATYTSVANWTDNLPEEVRRWFGIIVFDEGHHVSAPVFSKTADAFYGRRYSLTATPERDDGLHIIADMHIGKVLHKDLTQPLTADFVFYWTGLSLDLTDPECDVLDKNREIHASKVFRYFGRWKPRLYRIIQDAVDAVSCGRRVLVVGNSVDEVVNLMAIWTYGANADLITDIPYPTPASVGESLTPLPLSDVEGKKLERALATAKARKAKVDADAHASQAMKLSAHQKLIELEAQSECYRVYRKCEAANEKLRTAYIKKLTEAKSTAGFMVFGVPAEKRQQFVQERLVTFVIAKYGKEGLDAPHLDTILVSSPFSNRGGLQQLMGRITGRPKPGKKKCLVVFYRDNVGPMHGMCKSLEKHLRSWPADEGGPYSFTHVNNPTRAYNGSYQTLKEAFEQG